VSVSAPAWRRLFRASETLAHGCPRSSSFLRQRQLHVAGSRVYRLASNMCPSCVPNRSPSREPCDRIVPATRPASGGRHTNRRLSSSRQCSPGPNGVRNVNDDFLGLGSHDGGSRSSRRSDGIKQNIGHVIVLVRRAGVIWIVDIESGGIAIDPSSDEHEMRFVSHVSDGNDSIGVQPLLQHVECGLFTFADEGNIP